MANNPIEDPIKPARKDEILTLVGRTTDLTRESRGRTLVLLLITATISALAPGPENILGIAASVILASSMSSRR